MPITWKNINAPNLTGASNILNQAGQSLNRGISNIQDIINGGLSREKQTVENASEGFRNELQKRYSNPTDLKKAQQSGEVDALRQQFGKLNAKTTGASAVSNLIGSLQSQTIRDNQFTDSELRKNERPILDQIAKLNSVGDYDAAEEVANSNQLSNLSGTLQDIASQEKGAIRESERVTDREQKLLDNTQRRKDADVSRYRERISFQRKQKQFDEQDAQAAQNELSDGIISDLLTNADPNGNATDLKTRAISRLKESGLSLAEATTKANELDSMLVNATQESQIATRNRNNELAALERDPLIARSTSVKEFKEQKSPIVTTNEIFSELSEKFLEDLSSSETDSLRQLVPELAAGGLVVNGTDGNPIRVPLTKSMIQAGINQINTKGVWWKPDENDLDDILKNMVDGGVFDEDLFALESYQQSKAEIEAKHAASDGYKNLLNSFK